LPRPFPPPPWNESGINELEVRRVPIEGLEPNKPVSRPPDDHTERKIVATPHPDGPDLKDAVVETPAPAGVENDLQTLTEQLKRMQADFENFRRRKEEEQERQRGQAAARITASLLPVIDNLERAVESARVRTPADPLAEGLELILRQMKEALAAEGVQEIESDHTPFDPARHEAVGRINTTEHPDGTILETMQKGYTLNNRVIRPALVKVAHGRT